MNAQPIKWKKTRNPQEYVSKCGTYTVYKFEGSWKVYVKGGGFSDCPKFRTLKAAKLSCEEHRAKNEGDHSRALAMSIWGVCAN